MAKAVIMGATSGIGYETAVRLVEKGWEVGIAGRRLEKLEELQRRAPERIHIRVIDVRSEKAADDLAQLVDELGGMELYIHCSGIGSQNAILNGEIELNTVDTNVAGFVRLVDWAFSYFAKNGGGHICDISSIAGTRGLGVTPAYSASKRFQNTYLDALEQLAHLRGLPITFTDVRPGFVNTPFLNDGRHYPMMLSAQSVAQALIDAVEKKKRVLVVDWRYRILVFFWRLVPQCIWKYLPIRTERIDV